MPLRTASAIWEGDLTNGKGRLSLGSGSFVGNYSFRSRFEEGEGTNPEELIGAAHAGCVSMSLALELQEAGFTPEKINTKANVNLIKTPEGFKIKEIKLVTEAEVPGIEKDTFLEHAENAKQNCPVSQALTGVRIDLLAVLVSG